MSCFHTQAAVRDRSKIVTRRKLSTWINAKPGDRVAIVEKGQGLKRGEKQVVMAEVGLVDVRVEAATKEYVDDEAVREGFPDLTYAEFQARVLYPLTGRGDLRRIEWVYVHAWGAIGGAQGDAQRCPHCLTIRRPGGRDRPPSYLIPGEEGRSFIEPSCGQAGRRTS